MKVRQEYGDANRVGRTICELRRRHKMKQKDLLARMQTSGIDIGETSLSMLEGQFRAATDKELWVLADIFDVPMEELYNKEE